MFLVYLFKPVLISFVNMIGFFPRSIFNKYTVINFKWCLGRRLLSILLKAKWESILLFLRSRPSSTVFLGFSPGFFSWFLQHYSSLIVCISVQTEVALPFTGAAFLGSRSYLAWKCHHQWRRNPTTQASTQKYTRAIVIFSLHSVCPDRKRRKYLPNRRSGCAKNQGWSNSFKQKLIKKREKR